MTIYTYPLGVLYLHPLNVRSEPTPEEIALLAESIEQVGLLQNLLGYEDLDRPGEIGIVGGGRRLRALQSLPSWADAEIPVEVCFTESVAREWALTENTARKALNPADEIVAYRRMATTVDPDQIAKAFGVTGRYVRHRLKLSHLPDDAIEALRSGTISLDQAAALTHARTDADVIEILPRVIRDDWSVRTPAGIRNALLPDSVPVTDRRALFVGLLSYRAAGGEVAESLFFDDARLLDEALLDQMFKDKLQVAAEKLKGETFWRNVVVCYERYVPHASYTGMDRLHPVPETLSDVDQEAYDALSEESEIRELTDEEAERLDRFERFMDGSYTDEDFGAGTAFYVINTAGELEFQSAYRPRETTAGDDDGEASRVETKAETLPQNLRDDLRVIQTLAIQQALLSRGDLVQALLYITTCKPIAPHMRPLALSPTAQTIVPSKSSNTLLDERLASALPVGYDDLTAEMLADALAMPAGRRDTEICAALARTFCRASNTPIGAVIAAEIDAHPRDVWNPDADNFFRRLPAGMLDQIWADLVPSDLTDHSKFRAMKKAEKAKELDLLFRSDDTREAIGLSRDQNAQIDRWVPQELHWPHMDRDPAPDSKPAAKPRRAKKERAARCRCDHG